ncbi:hypothetical protein CMI37_17810 [Candidatus Pacearchaeota archaeon]|nr:hypothetical protein [Candidatus Pacearchaeota archaeon]|tara:strand:- start:586 stop:801 length:216 start_codon:yes stop_codon:yes gene_type:complete
MAQFKPSKASLTPKRQALMTLRYTKKAVASLEEFIEKSDDVPGWVLTKINQSATCLGAALSYASFKKDNGR